MFSVGVISLTGVITFLIVVAIIVFLLLGLKWLCDKLGFTLPQPMWAVLGFILILVLILYLLGIFGTGAGIVIR